MAKMEILKPTIDPEKELEFIREMIKLTVDNEEELNYWKKQRNMFVTPLMTSPKYTVPLNDEV